MNYLRLLGLGLVFGLLASCGSLPERIESDDIPSWCQEEEEDVSLMPYLLPGISTIVQIADALSDESFYACGIATGSEIGATRRAALVNAKKQIHSQLIGRVLSKVKRDELIEDYETHIHDNAFGYKTVEFESIDIRSGYTIFLLIETKGKDLIGTVEALRSKKVIRQDQKHDKTHNNAGYFKNDIEDNSGF
ncbi:MAG: hypothetical protein PSN36_01220 [Gammaproteobacteria bacterium]|nr:hypothetical protein [Gammaproteobacteria bacterium]